MQLLPTLNKLREMALGLWNTEVEEKISPSPEGGRLIRATTAPLRGNTWTLIALISLLALAAGVGCQQASGEQTAREPEGGQDSRTEARADAEGGAVARASGHQEVRVGDAVTKGRDGEGKAESRKATLEIEGDPGTGFSGKCTVGNEEREIRGQVPERFVFELDGRKLECEISKQSTGTMNVDLDAGGADYVQRTDSRRTTVRIFYSGQGYSSSIQSSIGTSRQTINSGSSSIVSSSSSSISRIR
jgi:hypothetical protein